MSSVTPINRFEFVQIVYKEVNEGILKELIQFDIHAPLSMVREDVDIGQSLIDALDRFTLTEINAFAIRHGFMYTITQNVPEN